ncbi:MAG: sulfatase [Isosphaerales bacterium]
MISRTDVFEGAGTVASPSRDLAANRLGPLAILVLSAWCGLVSGLLEVGTTVLRKQAFDVNHFYWMSRHFIWLVPLTNLVIFLLVGVVLSLLALGGRRRGRWLATRILGTMALLPVFWAAFPRIHAAAGLLLMLGLAARLVPALERRAAGVGRLVRKSLPVLAGLVPVLAASLWGLDRLREWREDARALPPPYSPNVLLIVLDTVGADHLSLYGYNRRTCPTIDGLAQRGICFNRARASSSWTLPSHASMFAGRWPHEVSAGWLTPLDATYPTLAEFLGARGYATAGFTANHAYCGTDSGLARGFTVYQDYIFPALTASHMAALINRPVDGLEAVARFLEDRLDFDLLRPALQRLWRLFNNDRKEAEVINREFLDWLSRRRHPERPFFAFLNFFDAHYPYQLSETGIHRFGAKPRNNREMDLIDDWLQLARRGPSEQQLAFVRDAYDNCVADLDEQLGRLIDELERRAVLEWTWVIIAADHGESFGEHPRVFRHGGSLYQTELHVPLVIIPPAGGPTKQVVTEAVSLRDLAATVVDVLGFKARSPFPGDSLARFWNGSSRAVPAKPAASLPALSEVVPIDTLNPDPSQLFETRWPLAALSEGDWTYIRREGDVREELFHLREDANELNNRAGDPAMEPTLERMRQALGRLTGGPLTPQRFSH